MSSERARIEAALHALESQPQLLGSTVTDAAVASLRAQLASVATEPAAPVLKQVTILFVDVVGSTSLSQRLDPEQTSDVMDTALARFAGIVTRHGGKVLKYAGDSVLAVFGAGEPREDDPERAVRAGLALREEGQARCGTATAVPPSLVGARGLRDGDCGRRHRRTDRRAAPDRRGRTRQWEFTGCDRCLRARESGCNVERGGAALGCGRRHCMGSPRAR